MRHRRPSRIRAAIPGARLALLALVVATPATASAQGYYGETTGALRLQVTPAQAEVFVDGYPFGIVDDFDGLLQRLRVPAGEHLLEFYAPGHRLLRQIVPLAPGRTYKLRAALLPLEPGEPAPGHPGRPPFGLERNERREALPQADKRPPSEYGSLHLVVRPADARVSIDGQPWPKAQDEGRLEIQLPVGRHRVVVEAQGRNALARTVAVLGGEITTLNVSLTDMEEH